MSKGAFLGEFELYVMAALVRLGAEAYGMAVWREIEARTGRDVALGAVYATLARLERKGFVTTRTSKPDPVPGGRARRLAQVTPAGRRAFDHAAAMLTRMLPAQARKQ